PRIGARRLRKTSSLGASKTSRTSSPEAATTPRSTNGSRHDLRQLRAGSSTRLPGSNQCHHGTHDNHYAGGNIANDNAAETVRKGSVADPQFIHLIPGASGAWMTPLRTDRNMDGGGLETWRDSSSGSSLSLSRSVCASDRYGQGAPGGTPSGERLGRYFWSIVPKAGSS